MSFFSIEHPELLTPDELIVVRAQRRRRWLLAALLLVLVTLGVWGNRPLVRAVKSWHSRRLAAEALTLVNHQQWLAARDKAFDAYTFCRTEPSAIRAVGRLLARTRSNGALPYFLQLRDANALTPEDRRDFAGCALAADDLTDAAEQSDWLLAHHPPGTDATPADLLLAAQSASAEGREPAALDFARRLLARPAATGFQQFTAAVRLVNAAAAQGEPNGPAAAPAWERIRHLADSHGPVALDALTLLSRRPAGKLGESFPPEWMKGSDIARALASHPLANVSHQLLALDLTTGPDATARKASLDAAVSRWRDADDTGLNALAAWLLVKGETARALDVLPLARTLKDAALFSHRLDGLAATGGWDEIKTDLSRDNGPLDEVARHMYLANAHAHLEEKAGADFEWSRAQEAAAGKPDRLFAVGQYAESQNAPEPAEAAYAAAIAAAPRLRVAYLAILRLMDSRGQTADAEKTLAAMQAEWPEDDVINDAEAYHRLLLGATGTDAEAIEKTAASLAAKEKGNWAVRATLSLARLRQGQSTGALQAFAGLRAGGNASVPPGALAVRAAAMAATGWKDEARADARALTYARLCPEERALIAPLLAE